MEGDAMGLGPIGIPERVHPTPHMHDPVLFFVHRSVVASLIWVWGWGSASRLDFFKLI
jgi:hypothetical protein